MKSKRSKRPVAELDRSNQVSLFVHEDPCEVVRWRAQAPARAARFTEPDPRQIRVNAVPLEDLLRQTGQSSPLKLRALLSELSFTEFESTYEPGGRPPYAPRAMLGVILSGILQGITSLRELERYARLDIGCWWISGAIMPDHSVLGRFIQRHESLLTESFFETLTRQVLKVTGSGAGVVAGDGTVIEAAASRYRLMKAEALREARQAAQIALQSAPEDRIKAERFATLQEAERILVQRQNARESKGKDASFMKINPQEPEAVVQQQKDGGNARASYKPSVMANEARVIVACEVHPSSETEVLCELIQQTQALGKVTTMMLDAGYFNAGTLTVAAEQHIEVLCPPGKTHAWENTATLTQKFFPKERFAYDTAGDFYRCPGAQQMKPSKRFAATQRSMSYVEYTTPACSDCQLAINCTRSKQGRRVKRYDIDGAKESLRTKMHEREIRQRYGQRRAIVEPVFSQLRGTQGLNRFRRTGLKSVRVEFALHAMAYNLGRAALRKSLLLFGMMRCVRLSQNKFGNEVSRFQPNLLSFKANQSASIAMGCIN